MYIVINVPRAVFAAFRYSSTACIMPLRSVLVCYGLKQCCTEEGCVVLYFIELLMWDLVNESACVSVFSSSYMQHNCHFPSPENR